MKLSHPGIIFFSLAWNNGANVAKSNDEEGSGLKEQVDPEVIATKQYIIDPTVDKVQSYNQLQQTNPIKTAKINRVKTTRGTSCFVVV